MMTNHSNLVGLTVQQWETVMAKFFNAVIEGVTDLEAYAIAHAIAHEATTNENDAIVTVDQLEFCWAEIKADPAIGYVVPERPSK